MILSDKDIKKYLKDGRIKIDPLEEDQIEGAWIDLRLGNEFKIFKTISTPYIDIKYFVDGYTETIIVKEGEPFIIHPGEFVLASTKEYIKVPDDLMGVVDGRSSLGRLGIVVHATAAGINPGWEGVFTLEIINVGKMPVALYPGMRICKLVLHKLTSPAEKPYYLKRDAKYQKQRKIEESKIFKDFT
ncbi:MAG: dCTP deaminase [Candidatus Aenigmatarchaeota archaeon]